MEIINENADRIQFLGVKIITPTEELMEQLKLKKGQKVVVIHRLSYANEIPFAYDVKYLLYDKGKPVVEDVIYNASLMDIVATWAPIFSVKNELAIYTGEAKGEETDYLKVENGYPLMIIEQKPIDSEGKPLGWGRIFYRWEYCRLHAVSSIK